MCAELGVDWRTIYELVVVGNLNDPATQEMLSIAQQRLLPGTVTAVIPAPPTDTKNGRTPEQSSEWLLLEPRPQIDGRVTAYLCQQQICKLPVNRPDDLAHQLDDVIANRQKKIQSP